MLNINGPDSLGQLVNRSTSCDGRVECKRPLTQTDSLSENWGRPDLNADGNAAVLGLEERSDEEGRSDEGGDKDVESRRSRKRATKDWAEKAVLQKKD